MPLDEIARRYADSIYQRRFHEISSSEEQEINQLRNQHAARGSILSGGYIHDHFKLLLRRIDTLVQAKAEGLLKAYEKSGLPFDERAFSESKLEVVDFCHSQQHHLIAAMGQIVRQPFGPNTPAGTLDSLSKQIVSEIDAILGRLVVISRSSGTKHFWRTARRRRHTRRDLVKNGTLSFVTQTRTKQISLIHLRDDSKILA
jgi:hypothetical protein